MKPETKPMQTAAPTPSMWSRIEALTDYFAWPLRTSHYVELLNPLWVTHALQARVVKVWDETKDARTLTLRPGLNWRAACVPSTRRSGSRRWLPTSPRRTW